MDLILKNDYFYLAMQKIYLSLLFVAVVVLNACSPVFYQPNTANIPMLTELDEHRFAATYTSGAGDGLEMQYAGTIGPNMALMLNGMYLSNGDTSNFNGYGSLIEAGLGFYSPMGKRFNFNLFAGFGAGNAKIQKETNNQASFGYYRYFFQPSIGFRSKYFEIGFAPRVCGIDFDDVNNSLFDEVHRSSLTEFSRKLPIVIEPSMVIRSGYKNVMFQLSFNEVLWLNKPEFAYNFSDFVSSSISLGICLRFGYATRPQ